jgi:prevent-host-death family protein
MTMTIRTSSSQFKAKMGQYMRAVRAGKEIVITDRDQPIARLLPYRERAGREPERPAVASPRDPASPPLGQLEVSAIAYRGPSTTSVLAEDRARR